METSAWTIQRGESPLIAAAIHNGHEVRDELTQWLALPEADRLQEEDPHTGAWTTMAPTRIVVHRSRFEVDLNRPREKAVYLHPEDAWGLRVWRDTLPDGVLERSLGIYDAFYQEIDLLLRELIHRYGRVVVFDLHSYNHRRAGPGNSPAPSAANPTISLGTSNMDLGRWGPMVERFEQALRSVVFRGEPLDVRRDVKFRGGYFARWIHQTFPASACAPAIEVKKVFMDEWSGRLDDQAHALFGQSLFDAAGEVLRQLPEGGSQP
jgi:N-formylglutamate deformylase